MITRQVQPTPHSCGQTCVAMIAGVPVAEVMRELPDIDRGTTATELAQALRARGFAVPHPARMRRMVPRANMPELAIVRLVHPARGRLGHWVVREIIDSTFAFVVHDPGVVPLDNLWRAVSYLAIRRTNAPGSPV
jgi:hypothetical protein